MVRNGVGAGRKPTGHVTLARSNKRTVLIAGGAGFLGSHLCDHHIAAGDKVVCIDNLQTGRIDNISQLMDESNFSFLLHDIIEPLNIQCPVDLIYNMACPASPDKYQMDPVHTFKTSVLGALNLLDLARATGARILQASTSEVYGDPAVSPQSEDYWGNVNPFGPRSCYDEGKRSVETLFYDYHERHGVETRIARIFNTYGPRMDPEDGRVVSNFVTQALRGEDITLYGDGSQTRSFCYVDDLIDGLIALMEAPQGTSDPVNIGNPCEFTVRELAEMVLAKVGSTSHLTQRALPVDDPRQRCPDIARARARLGWWPRIDLAQGLDWTITYFAAELGKNAPRIAQVS